MGRPRIDLTGQKFGRWTVLQATTGYRWICRCECGREQAVLAGNLRSGETKQCLGCKGKVLRARRIAKNGNADPSLPPWRADAMTRAIYIAEQRRAEVRLREQVEKRH